MAINDRNTRLRVYLCNLYGIPQASARADVTSLVQRNLASRTGDYNNRFNALVTAALAVTPVGVGGQAMQGTITRVVVA